MVKVGNNTTLAEAKLYINVQLQNLFLPLPLRLRLRLPLKGIHNSMFPAILGLK